ncbi:N-acetyllactosaminide beta-1,6-N-acetylglucosaminyl-transferase-like [Clavelina lepadiformis]|uniref:N-acetyllactosaminide beta-1,6-N-acetylglucosaminyl-transferase-like n=1 Tax=Clavelina lepadiformis TaxID=159417 RepID=UPI004043809A
MVMKRFACLLVVSAVVLYRIAWYYSWTCEQKTDHAYPLKVRSDLSRVKNTTRLTIKNDGLCLNLMNGTKHLNMTNKKTSDFTSDYDVKSLASKGCNHVIDKYDFEMDFKHITKEERDFPIAYSILAHQNAHQLMLLLSAIYAPQNVYCIHIDLKSTSMFEAVKEIASCFANVFLATKREDVVYAGFSRLQADINCMKDLVNIPVATTNWIYLINLCGQDFPLRTNLEITKQLKKLNGRNQIHGEANPVKFVRRTKYIHKVVNRTGKDGMVERIIIRTSQLKSPPPFNMIIRKNSAYNIYTRRFLRWVIFESEKAKALLEWSRDTLTPDEHYWLMLDALEEAPGRTGKMSGFTLSPYVSWNTHAHRICGGYWRHYSCVFGSNDLGRLVRQNKLFANKFDVTYDSLPVTCLRKWLDDRKFRTNEIWNPHRSPVSIN